MEYAVIKGIRIFAPISRQEFLTSNQVIGGKLVAMNAEKIYKADSNMKNLYETCINYPDGIGAVWALKQKGLKKSIKIPGCELWLDFIKYYENDKRFYLIGGSQEVIDETVEKLKVEYPSLNIVGSRNGFIKNDDEKKVLFDDILIQKPDFVFVAMGSPRQEKLIDELYQIHQATYQGLGGSFDVYTNRVKRAPKFWIRLNMEWAYRLLLQPKRILRQYTLLFFLLNLKLNRY